MPVFSEYMVGQYFGRVLSSLEAYVVYNPPQGQVDVCSEQWRGNGDVLKRQLLKESAKNECQQVCVWRGGSMVSVRDSRSEGREFDPRPRHTA